MSLRTAEAFRESQDAERKLYRARFDSKVGVEEFKLLQREAQLKRSIYDNLQRLEPATAAEHKALPKRSESVGQQQNRSRGQAIVAEARRRQRAHRDALTDRNALYRNPLFETSTR